MTERAKRRKPQGRDREASRRASPPPSDERLKEIEAAYAKQARFEAHEKTRGDTAKMRARLGLEPGVIGPGAWKVS